MTRKKTKLVYGWGVNDVDYCVSGYTKIDGKRVRTWECPYYKDWNDMLCRGSSQRLKKNRPTYETCTICEEWKYLSNFIKWVDSQPNKDWQNCCLDKDLLGETKEYQPNNCSYISKGLNSFIIDSKKSRGSLFIGVALFPKNKKNPYQAYCSNPFTRKQEHLGYFATELEAHKAWQAKKHEHACQLADLQADERVAKALRERYAPDKDWTNK